MTLSDLLGVLCPRHAGPRPVGQTSPELPEVLLEEDDALTEPPVVRVTFPSSATAAAEISTPSSSESAMSIYCGGLDLEAFGKLPVVTRVSLAASDLLGWAYSRDNHFPASRPGLPKKLVVPSATNLGIDCSSAGAYVLVTATPAGRWDEARYGELQIFDPKLPWSPLDAVERAGIGRKLSTSDRKAEWDLVVPVPGKPHVTQAWQDDRLDDGDPVEEGHFRISIADVSDPDLLRVFESTTRKHPITGASIGPTWTNVRLSDLRKKYAAGVRLAVID